MYSLNEYKLYEQQIRICTRTTGSELRHTYTYTYIFIQLFPRYFFFTPQNKLGSGEKSLQNILYMYADEIPLDMYHFNMNMSNAYMQTITIRKSFHEAILDCAHVVFTCWQQKHIVITLH